MAIGLSGSGGGITFPSQKIQDYNDLYNSMGSKFNLKYVDYFINDVCNLKCKHCYVGYEDPKPVLSISELTKAFDFCIKSGAKVFGVVGKEPLMSWERTRKVLKYFSRKKELDNSIKFGMVTNGLLLDESKISDLFELGIDYIDISLEGNKNINDSIRGNGTYEIVTSNLLTLKKYGLNTRTFISFTLNRINQHSLETLLYDIYPLGISRILISPYLSIYENDELSLSVNDYGDLMQNIIDGRIIDFSYFKGLEIHIRNDYRSLKYQNELLSRRIIDIDKLFIDNNDAIFQTYNVLNENKVIVNLQNWNPDYWYGFRISHDGFISNCHDMFYKDYHQRAIGNIRTTQIKDLITSVVQNF